MKYIIILFISINSLHAQDLWFCGTTKNEVKKALSENKKDFTEDKLTDSTKRISWEIIGDFQMIWVFDLKDSLKFQSLFSLKDNGINEIVSFFNREFVVVSTTKWRHYKDGIIYEIELKDLIGIFYFSINSRKLISQ